MVPGTVLNSQPTIDPHVEPIAQIGNTEQKHGTETRNRNILFGTALGWKPSTGHLAVCLLIVFHVEEGELSLMLSFTENFDAARRRLLKVSGWIAWLLVWCCITNMAFGDWRDDVGYTQLVGIIGAGAPNGAGVPISLVEALQTVIDDMGTPEPEDDVVVRRNYQPDPSASQFTAGTDLLSQNVTFIDGSNNSCNGPCISFSTHAYGQAQNLLGNTTSSAPAANVVTVSEADDYLNNILNMSGGKNTMPDSQDFRVQSFSWIGTFDDDDEDREALRRFDYSIDDNNILAAVGLNNVTAPLPILLSHSYNSIAVGRTDGTHSSGLTTLADYGTGRSKPELVVPQSTTSGATSSLSSAATFLHSASTVLSPMRLSPKR